MEQLTKEIAASAILHSNFNHAYASPTKIFCKILQDVYAQDQNIEQYLNAEKSRMTKTGDFKRYYGFKGYGHSYFEKYILENETDSDFIIRCAKELGEDYLPELERSIKSTIEQTVWFNYKKLSEHSLLNCMCSFNSDFRGEVVEVRYFGGVDESIPMTIIIETVNKGERNFYFIEKTQYGPRLASYVFNDFKSIICYILSPEHYSAILKILA